MLNKTHENTNYELNNFIIFFSFKTKKLNLVFYFLNNTKKNINHLCKASIFEKIQNILFVFIHFENAHT